MYLDKGFALLEAIEKTVLILEGAYSFVLISILEPEAMYIVKNTGTMVIGVSKALEELTRTQNALPLLEKATLRTLSQEKPKEISHFN